MPKRPLSAYNIFFRKERQALLGEDIAKEHVITDQSRRKHRKTHGKIGFADMARMVGEKWKKLDTTKKQAFEEQADHEKTRYIQELDVWKKTQEEDPTEEPTETESTGYIMEDIIRKATLRDEESQADWGMQIATPMEARLPQPQALPQTLPQAETAQFPTIFQREEDYRNETRFHGRNAYVPMINTSLPANFGGNDPISAMRGRASLPANLPSHYGDNSPYAMARGRASLPGGPPDAYQQVPPRSRNPRPIGGIWSPQAASTGFGGDPFYSQAQNYENELVRQMEEKYRMHLAEAALLRERLDQHGDTGTHMNHLRQQQGGYPGSMPMHARLEEDSGADTMNHLRQQQGAYPGSMPMQARREEDSGSDTGGVLEVWGVNNRDNNEARMAERLAIERAQTARRANLLALQRVLDNERVMRQEEELRRRRFM
jgi:hypothetical protein